MILLSVSKKTNAIITQFIYATFRVTLSSISVIYLNDATIINICDKKIFLSPSNHRLMYTDA